MTSWIHPYCYQTRTPASGAGVTRVTNDLQGDILGYCILVLSARFAIPHLGSHPKPQGNRIIFAHPSTFYRTRCTSDRHMPLAERSYHSRLPTVPWRSVDSAPFFPLPCCRRGIAHDRHAGRREIDLQTAILVPLGRISLARGAWEAARQDAAPACRREIAASCGCTLQRSQGVLG